MHAITSDMLLGALISRTIVDEPAMSMGALSASPIPAGIIRYMRACITTRLAEDLARAPHFARVTSPTAGPDKMRDALLTHAAEQYVFPREEFLEMLENAVHFTENYLCRPRWTLTSFLFMNQEAITAATLLHKLEYITEYAYLPQLLRRYVTKTGKQVITAGKCASYIARIDDAVLREHSPRERALLSKPIFRFYFLSEDVDNKTLPLRPLLLFLEDKLLTSLKEYAEGVWHIRNKTEITLEEFIALNEDFASGRPPAGEPAEPPVAGLAAGQAGLATGQVQAAPAPAAEPVPAPAPPPEAPPVEPPPLETAPPPTEATPEPPLPERGELVQESLPFPDEPAPPEPQPPAVEPPPRRSLKEMLSDDLRKRFIQEICGKDAEFYDLVIARLDDMESWSEASAYIWELFEINSIDPFDETAVAFTDMVQKKCLPREG